MSRNCNDIIKSAIVPIQSTSLTKEEGEVFKRYNPLGYILFSRNYENPIQLKCLIESLKDISGRDDVLILIDQEGERVSRLREPHFTVLKNASEYCAGRINDDEVFESLVRDFKKIGAELRNVGINVNCAPVADLHHVGADPIIGVRSYGDDVTLVSKLCTAVDLGLAQAHIQSVIKHIPGHGRANIDSHIALPTVHDDLTTLINKDFAIFNKLKAMKLAMTAHIVFAAIDDIPATLSQKTIRYIREVIGFEGLIMTDALDMKALSGPVDEIVVKAQDAGCDILLYCEPDLNKVIRVLKVCRHIQAETLDKVHKFNCFL